MNSRYNNDNWSRVTEYCYEDCDCPEALEACSCAKRRFEEMWWSSFCSIWTWIVHQNMLVEVNKYLIEDLARSEELLEKATIKLGKKWTIKS